MLTVRRERIVPYNGSMHTPRNTTGKPPGKTYLVGGAVRDRLLGLPVVDQDWVVVGATAAEMVDAGYLPIGKDFPVFLHPESKEEYALARTERKSGKGYHGFTFHASPEVTLEEDLARRDLTLNAMAEDESGAIIDPYNGQDDLQHKRLRHVSTAFDEDPVRILRVARFHARYRALGFSVADETLDLMRAMVDNQEAAALVPERVWQETHKALLGENPRVFFETLRECNALAVIFPEIDCLFGVPQPEQWHPEIDTGLHTMMVLDQACAASNEPATRFAALCHDLGKGVTPKDQWPSHHGHEKTGADLVKTLCARLRVPADYRDLAYLVARFHTHLHRIEDLTASKICKMLASLDVMRKPARFAQFLIACEADARGRLGLEHRQYLQADYLEQAANVFCAVDAATIAASCKDKSQIAGAIHQARVSAVKAYIRGRNAES